TRRTDLKIGIRKSTWEILSLAEGTCSPESWLGAYEEAEGWAGSSQGRASPAGKAVSSEKA
ncbi:MAG TPA: hypothetical protein VEP28_10700, partial [Rubrobacter sp.]|nr:hypothetical protein [Rubrobacter sp.]